MSGAGGSPALVDCCVVNDEIELLDQRIAYLADQVDAFVIVEAKMTFRGAPKPAHVADSHLLERWKHLTIHHVILEDLPASSTDQQAAAWEREACQRDAIVRCLGQFDPHDLAIVCDVDEFPSVEAIAELRRGGLKREVRLEMMHCVGFVNIRTRLPWIHPFAAPIMDLHSIHSMRMSPRLPMVLLKDAGWHLSYLDVQHSSPRKFEQYSHTEFDRSYLKSRLHLSICAWLGVHPPCVYKLLDVVPQSELSRPLFDRFSEAWSMRSRGFGRKYVAALYAGTVSIAIGENWRVRGARDALRRTRGRAQSARELV